ncbi:junctional sarcoplasmic reticulum protein 1 [Erinaceus europaeus]|uniref:Junctional sarcoplasmic reticulum protein 1 n=1 Tax=Erinaceus europaeus TaxID=9365 RepID=A0ABM3WNR6_ERIEU|nr:junctional sarcoplasmic reticulum protein 1 [Erinaceus europaeus]
MGTLIQPRGAERAACPMACVQGLPLCPGWEDPKFCGGLRAGQGARGHRTSTPSPHGRGAQLEGGESDPGTLGARTPGPDSCDISMATSSWEQPEGGLGAVPRMAEVSGQSYGPCEQVDAGGGKTERERVSAPGRERTRSGGAAAPRSPARRKAQAAPPQTPPEDELPWTALTLTQCLVLATLVALLGSAGQLCRDAMLGEAAPSAHDPEPQPLVQTLPSSLLLAAPAEAQQRPEKMVEASGELAGSPLEVRGPQDRPRKVERHGEEERRRPRRERPEPRRPRVQDSGDPASGKRRAPASPRRPERPAVRDPKGRRGRD